MKIDKFDGDYRFLSNFWMIPIPLENVWYESTEHAYQAAKSNSPDYKKSIRLAKTPGEAKKLGRKADLRPDWEEVKLGYMRYLVWYKFAMYPDLGQKLLDTGDAELVEGNHWGDKFWGVCNGVGENWLGKILMEVREQIRRNGMSDTPPQRVKKVFVPKDNTFDPKSGQVFVFGSNRAGIHGAGAALYARKDLGALQGVGEGLLPTADKPGCYALPTKDENIQTLPLEEIRKHVDKFIEVAWERKDLSFFVTRVGCGLAGLQDKDIAPMFALAPPNCELPPGWENFEEVYGPDS